MHDTQITGVAGGVAELGVGVALLIAAFMTYKYAMALQRRAAKLMRSQQGYSDFPSAGNKFARIYGTIFCALTGCYCLVLGLVAIFRGH